MPTPPPPYITSGFARLIANAWILPEANKLDSAGLSQLCALGILVGPIAAQVGTVNPCPFVTTEIFTTAVPLLVGSAWLVAITWYVPRVLVAEYTPVPVMMPPLAPSLMLQFTAAFVVPVTFATNVCVPPGGRVIE